MLKIVFFSLDVHVDTIFISIDSLIQMNEINTNLKKKKKRRNLLKFRFLGGGLLSHQLLVLVVLLAQAKNKK